MPTVATCPCGQKFVISGSTYPRTVACHGCGARTIIYHAGALEIGDGWKIGEEQSLHPSPKTDEGGTVRCFICRVPAFTACARCGKFYCSRHGRPQFNSLSTCLDCYDRRRPAFFISGCIFAAAAVAIGWIALMAPGPNDSKLPYYAIFLPMAATSLLGAVGFFWYSWRSYP